jgi:pSer/pThr/pTyr-binding forkhead associated (FHA) protein
VIQIEILNGSKAGTHGVARQFPFRVGRERSAALSLTDDGIWESHFEVDLRPREGCFISARAEGLTLVNGQTFESPHRLRNGDIIEAGSVKLRFVLGPTRQHSLVWREVLTWVAIGLLCGAQLALIYFVLP